MLPTARVLAADVPEMDEKLRECLAGHDITFVRTMYEAMRALRHDGFQLVVIGLEFDESRMLELLQHVRGLPAYKNVPVVCVHADNHDLSEAVMKNIDVAVKALGGMAFLNLGTGAIKYREDCAFLDHAAIESATLHPN
jgi:PleD family two-component response regulator